MSSIISDELVKVASVLSGENEARVRAVLYASLPLLLKELVPSMEEIAVAIDNNYDEEQYRPVYTRDGDCVDSNAARAVYSLFLPENLRSPELKGNEHIKEVYRLIWEQAYQEGVDDERMSQEVTDGMHAPNRVSPYA